jgi:hypothetical protein
MGSARWSGGGRVGLDRGHDLLGRERPAHGAAVVQQRVLRPLHREVVVVVAEVVEQGRGEGGGGARLERLDDLELAEQGVVQRAHVAACAAHLDPAGDDGGGGLLDLAVEFVRHVAAPYRRGLG